MEINEQESCGEKIKVSDFMKNIFNLFYLKKLTIEKKFYYNAKPLTLLVSI